MSPKVKTPVSDDEAQDFARRMSERGLQEATIYDHRAWTDFIDDTLMSERGRRASDAQLKVLERGRTALGQSHILAEVRIMPSITGVTPSYRYADITTGRIISAQAAYARLEAAGAPVPSVFRYK